MFNELLLALAVTTQPPPEAFDRVTAKLATYNLFPARPVYWPDDKTVGVGVIPDQNLDLGLATNAVCEVLAEEGLIEMTVEVYDVIKIQYEDEWEMMAFQKCDTY